MPEHTSFLSYLIAMFPALGENMHNFGSSFLGHKPVDSHGAEPLVASLPSGGLWLVFGGGAAYTLGVPFYLWKRLPFNHALWHVFVLLGSVLQFFAVWLYVLPGASR